MNGSFAARGLPKSPSGPSGKPPLRRSPWGGAPSLCPCQSARFLMPLPGSPSFLRPDPRAPAAPGQLLSNTLFLPKENQQKPYPGVVVVGGGW